MFMCAGHCQARTHDVEAESLLGLGQLHNARMGVTFGGSERCTINQ